MSLPAIPVIEQALLGGLILAGERIPEVAAILSPEDFFTPSAQVVFTALVELSERHVPVDYGTLAGHLGPRLAGVGGLEALLALSERATTPAAILWHARSLATARARYSASQAAQKASAFAKVGDEEDAREELERAMSALEPREAARGAVSAAVVASTALDAWEQPREAFDLGIEPIDRLLGGLERGNLCLIAAGAKGGKTALAICAALAVSRTQRVLYVTLEMGEWEITCRLLAALSGLDSSEIRKRRPEIRARVEQAGERLAGHDLRVLRGCGMTARKLRAEVRQEAGTALVVLDHMHLMKVPGATSAYERMTEISGALKDIATEQDVVMLALAQLNRTRTDGGRPRKEMLRDSGALEQDADQIILPWQGPDEPLLVDGGFEALEVWVDANRHGATGKASLDWHKPSNQIVASAYERTLTPAPRKGRGKADSMADVFG